MLAQYRRVLRCVYKPSGGVSQSGRHVSATFDGVDNGFEVRFRTMKCVARLLETSFQATPIASQHRELHGYGSLSKN